VRVQPGGVRRRRPDRQPRSLRARVRSLIFHDGVIERSERRALSRALIDYERFIRASAAERERRAFRPAPAL